MTADANIVTVAHRLLALELGVIPIPRPRPGVPPGTPGDGKVPSIPWREFQTRLPTADEIREWFGRTPMNLAVVTGAVSGVVVIDADARDALRWAVRHLPYTPWQTETARGFHLWYRHPGLHVPNRARMATQDGRLALDVRGDGGYVIAPGSVHASGVEYQFAGDWNEPRARVPVFWPGWLERTPRQVIERRARASHQPTTQTDILTRARAYLAAIPRPEIGAGSDQATFYAACRLVHGFALAATDAEDLLWAWAGGRPGWTREWVARKVVSAKKHGTEADGALLR
jgi:hypothetical protein